MYRHVLIRGQLFLVYSSENPRLFASRAAPNFGNHRFRFDFRDTDPMPSGFKKVSEVSWFFLTRAKPPQAGDSVSYSLDLSNWSREETKVPGRLVELSSELHSRIEKPIREIHKGVKHEKKKGVDKDKTHGEGVISLGCGLHKVDP